MTLEVRVMEAGEAELAVDYFHDSTPEHLEMLGVDPTRLPPRERWLEQHERETRKPLAERSALTLVWLVDAAPVGFSSADRIRFGTEAFMHLHILDPTRRWSGLGTEFVRRSTQIYFEQLHLVRLYCEPNAFNVAPNRTLQRAGFSFVKTHMTVPGPLNFHQAVTRWVLDGPGTRG
jgi:RimJ/RimL family protein N-acetyltransferase